MADRCAAPSRCSRIGAHVQASGGANQMDDEHPGALQENLNGL
ncbi:hypothetical protein [Bordetella genomosp. 9]|nr:hypothetical protein [Bordetella genomosp. 9]